MRRGAAITECGYDASKVKTLTRADFFQRLKDYGQQRMAMLTCMTCADTARRWKTWDEDPRMAIQREIDWERGGSYRGREDRGQRLKDELLAIASLIETHQEEFIAAVTGIEQRREWNERKAARAERPKAPPTIGGL